MLLLLMTLTSTYASQTMFCGDGDTVMDADDQVVGVLLAEDEMLADTIARDATEEVLSQVMGETGDLIGYVWGPHGHDPIGYVWGPHGRDVVGYVFGPHGDEDFARMVLTSYSRAR